MVLDLGHVYDLQKTHIINLFICLVRNVSTEVIALKDDKR